MAKNVVKPLKIKQIAGRSVASLSFLVVLGLALSVATYFYLTHLSRQQTELNVLRLSMTEQLTRNMSQLQVLEGNMTLAALAGMADEVTIRSEKLSEHLELMSGQMDDLLNMTADSRHEIRKVATSITEIYGDISSGLDELSSRLIKGDSISFQNELYSRLNQDIREFNNATSQLQKLFVKVIGLQHQLKSQHQLYYGGAAVIFCLLILFVFLGFRWNNKLVLSLNQLSSSIDKVKNGDFSVVTLKENDEIAAVTNLFNETIQHYKDAIIADSERETTQENLIGFLEVVSEAADGDLTMKAPVTADAFGSIADAYNLMVESLADLLMDTRRNANNVGEQSRHLIQIFEEMEMGAETQSSQVETATSIVQKSAVAAREISEKAALAQETSSLVDDVTEKGSRLVSNNIEGMQLIRVTVQVINKKMKSLSERLLEIGTISQLISEIATRTTILAMNASIEASRAGEQGRGFLVISDEIKRLADKSAEATKQISGVVKSIQSEAGEVTSSLEEETKTVEVQARLAQDTGESFHAIQEAIRQSKTVVTQISQLSNEQFEMTRNVEQAMQKVSEISQLALEQVKSSAAITTGLTEQSAELLNSVSAFRLPEDV